MAAVTGGITKLGLKKGESKNATGSAQADRPSSGGELSTLSKALSHYSCYL